MKCEPGKCIKCSKVIAINGAPTKDFCESEFMLTGGNHLLVAHCRECIIEPPEYGEVMAAINAALSPHPLEGRIKAFIQLRTFIHIALELQDGKCICGEDIKDHFVWLGNKLVCGHCRKLPKKKGKDEKPSRAGKIAREHNERNPRRERKGHVSL